MTKENYTAIALVIDESGSMNPIQTDTIGSINSFIDEQKKIPGDLSVTINFFADRTKTICNFVDIKDVPVINTENYKPHGWTALLDAVAKTVDDLGVKLSRMKEEDRPSKVIIAILTDGHENASRYATGEMVKKQLQHQTEVYNWTVLFLGANQDAWSVAESLGIAKGQAMTYTATGHGTSSAVDMVSRKMSEYRTTRGVDSSMLSFSAHDVDTYSKTVSTGAQVQQPTVQPQVIQVQQQIPQVVPHYMKQRRDVTGRFSK